jgi:hypothetical protein
MVGFVWTGHGWIGFAWAALCLIFTPDALDWLIPGREQDRGLEIFIAFIVTALGCLIAGRMLNRDLPTRIVDLPQKRVDPATGEQLPIAASQGHTVFFIRLEFAFLIAGPIFFLYAGNQLGWWGQQR